MSRDTPERFRRVEDLFNRALDLPEDERPAFLERECADREIRDRVHQLLERDAKGDSVEVPAWATPPTGGPEIGSRIGPYRLTEVLGEGGMGVVFEAEQAEPVRRSVALKLVRTNLTGTESIARFEAERQTLALMEHPCIAQVFDAGATETGQPYFVMELVRGSPVSEYCDAHCLDLHDRIRLFRRICGGVQHAHHKGIIHRDLKPSNILITERGGEPLPKIIDFGIARAIGDGLSGTARQTRAGQFVGTPEYMSPEQAGLEVVDVDTRTDVYSLGVLLYLLLVGSTPHDPDTLEESGFDEMRRIIREVDPPTPSARLTKDGDTAARVARDRGTEPPALRKRLRGDLDWITMKALDKDPSRRYNSPAELTADLDRFLRHEPVSAGPPSAGYRVAKFVRRHRVGMTAGVLVLVAILAGGAAATIGFLRARASEARAVEEAATSGAVTDFLVELFEESNPSRARGNEITAREVLDRGVDKVEELTDQPPVQARLKTAIGRVYRGLGLYDDARPLLEQGVYGIEKQEGDPRRAIALFELGRLEFLQGRYPAAEEQYRRALEVARTALPPGDPTVGFYMTHLATALQRLGHAGDARELFEESLAIQTQALGTDHIDTALTLYGLAWNRKMDGRLEEAREMYEQLVPVFERELGDDNPDLAFCLNDYANLLVEMSDRDAALPLLERALEVRRNALGSEHAFVAQTLDSLGSLHVARADYNSARPYYEEALAIREAVFGPDHAETGFSVGNLGVLGMREGDHRTARRAFRRALEIQEKAWGEEHRHVANVVNNMAVNERLMGLYDAALPLQLRANELLLKVHGPESTRLATGLLSLGLIHQRKGELEEALGVHERALEIYTEKLGPDHASTTRTQVEIATVRCLLGEVDAARSLFREALAKREASVSESAIAYDLVAFGLALHDVGKVAEARLLLERSLKLRQDDVGPFDSFAWNSQHALGKLYTTTGGYEKAEAFFEQAVHGFESSHGSEGLGLSTILTDYAALMRATGRDDEAAAMEARAERIRKGAS